MSRGGVILLSPRKPRAKRSRSARLRGSLAEVLAEVVTCERTQARLAWSVTAVGLVLGLALESL